MSWRVVATLALIAWGALAFGAVSPWAFTLLFVGLLDVSKLYQLGWQHRMALRDGIRALRTPTSKSNTNA